MKKKAIFMGTPDISVPFLDFLIKNDIETIVFTQKDKVRKRGGKLQPSSVKSRALELNIPVYDCSIKSTKAFDIINEFAPDIYLVVAYGQILPKKILDIPTVPINVHFSLLPEYRGATPVNTTLLDGKDYAGTTLMYMDEGLDTGDIIDQEKIDLKGTENATELFENLIDLSLNLLEKNMASIFDCSFKRTAQTGDVSYTKLIDKKDLIIDFCKESYKVFNMIRAYNDEPGVKTFFRDKILMIEKAVHCDTFEGEPGTIIDVSKKTFTVACKSGVIEIHQVKPEGKKSMTTSAFIAGYKPQRGELLG